MLWICSRWEVLYCLPRSYDIFRGPGTRGAEVARASCGFKPVNFAQVRDSERLEYLFARVGPNPWPSGLNRRVEELLIIMTTALLVVWGRPLVLRKCSQCRRVQL